MAGRLRGLVVAGALAAAGVTACSEDPAADVGLPPTTVATTPAPTATTSAPTTATTAAPTTATTAPPATTTTVAYAGLPEALPLPVAGVLTLTGGDRYTDGFAITGVSGEGVLAWMVEALPGAGWQVVEQTAEPGERRRFQGVVEFTGRGADGVASIAVRPDAVTVEVVFEARGLSD